MRSGEYVVYEVSGTIPEGTVFSGSGTGLTVEGKRKRISVLPTGAAGTYTGTFTATNGTNTGSIGFNLVVSNPLPQITISTFTSIGPTAYSVSGSVSNLTTPTNYKIVACSHADAFYCADFATLDGSGNFSNANYDLFGGHNFTDRITFLIADSGYAAAATSAGVYDSYANTATNYLIPFAIDGVNLLNFKNHHMLTTVAHADPQIQNLLARLSKHEITAAVGAPASPARLARSYLDSDQFYTYDQALAVMAFTKAGEQVAAQKVLNAMLNIHTSHGSLGWFYFSYNHDDSGSVYPGAGDRRISGAIAWFGLAVAYYKQVYPADTNYDSMAKAIVDYLRASRGAVTVNTVASNPLLFAPVNVAGTAWDESDVVSLEHNLDFHALLREYVTAYPGDPDVATYNTDRSNIRSFIESMWNASSGRFDIGLVVSTNTINTSEIALDTQSWTILSIGDRSLDTTKNYASGLTFNCNNYFETAGHINGFRGGFVGFFDGETVGVTPDKFVWSEGTAGHILAVKKVEAAQGVSISCDGFSSANLITELNRMALSDGGVPYSSATTNTNFTTSSSVAGTAWLYFVNQNFNPFDP